jgi:hypothetical protein
MLLNIQRFLIETDNRHAKNNRRPKQKTELGAVGDEQKHSRAWLGIARQQSRCNP